MKRIKIKRVEVFIEAPCNEIIESRFGKITYIEKLRMDRIELKKQGRQPKIERLHCRYTCKLVAIPVPKKKKIKPKKKIREWWE